MPIRYTTEDARSEEQANADDRIRNEVERTGGIWAQMTAEQCAQTLARLHDKKQRAQAARARKQAEQETLEERVARLESGSHDLEAEGGLPIPPRRLSLRGRCHTARSRGAWREPRSYGQRHVGRDRHEEFAKLAKRRLGPPLLVTRVRVAAEDPSILATSASDKPCTSRWYYPKLAVLREALDVGIAELDAGQGVETSPEKLIDEVFAEVGLEP